MDTTENNDHSTEISSTAIENNKQVVDSVTDENDNKTINSENLVEEYLNEDHYYEDNYLDEYIEEYQMTVEEYHRQLQLEATYDFDDND